PLLRGEQTPWRDSFLIEYFSDKVFPRVYKMGYQAVRDERWKYIHYIDLNGMDELYDLKADPYEMNNLAADSQAGETEAEMQAKLQQLLDSSKSIHITEIGGCSKRTPRSPPPAVTQLFLVTP